ncbi:hypothetical protein B566_EDAN009206 [Ephemera danica]|nr:hypothetical protein B566_EDAN009206 [Ephemera danica]
MKILVSCLVFCTFAIIEIVSEPVLEDDSEDLYSVEGKVFPPEFDSSISWQSETKIYVNGGEYLGFIKEDGSFVISNLQSGSYVIEVANPNYFYEPARVDINAKGKFRARKLNYVQTSQVVTIPYPLKMKPLSKLRYFQVREQWRVTDFLFNPMVLMMVLPLFLIMILPKMMNDPETKKEMEQLNNMTKYDMPEVSEMITSFFTGNEKPKSKGKAIKASKKKQ